MRVLILILSVSSTAILFAQTPSATPPRPPSVVASHPEWPKANPDDVAGIENIIRAFYSAVSTPAGGKLDRNRLRSLFVPGGRIVASRPANSSRAADICFLTPEEYAALSDAHNAEGFFDSNPANQIERFGAMAHVYSTYESRSNLDDPKPMARGIKSFELLNSGNRWYIVEVYWDNERPDNPIPERYLHNSATGKLTAPKRFVERFDAQAPYVSGSLSSWPRG
jgi:hypothetical protein